jgi:carbon-monoxide dehydrogenase small subunit
VRVYRGATEVGLKVNGRERTAVVRPGDTLLRTLRDALGLTGAKAGCENGDCGACTVLVDGRPVKSCLVLTLSVAGRDVTTIEGLSDTPLQRAFVRENGFQCGFCTPGVMMNAWALLAADPGPSAETLREWLESNLCRCTGYEGIVRAIRGAAGERTPRPQAP